MRVLHVIPSLSLRRGGPSASLRQLVLAQRAAGMDAAVLTTNDDCDTNNSLPLGKWFETEGVPVIAFERRLSPLRWYREHIVCPQALAWLADQAGQWDLQHVHAVFSYLSTGAMRLARRQRRPYVCRPLGQLCGWSLQQKSLKKRLYLRLLERANLAGAASMHFTSVKERDEFQDLGVTVREMIVPHGVALPERVSSQSTSGRINIVSLSRIDEKKGLDLLLRGFALAVAELPEARLLIAGDGDKDCIRNLRQLAASLGVSDRVHFTGWVEGQAKADLLNHADLFVLASHSENFGVAVVEAMACGVPVLITEGVALCHDVVTAGAGEQIGYQPEQIAASLSALGRDPVRRAMLGNNARALVAEKFTWPSVAKTLQGHYQDIIERHES